MLELERPTRAKIDTDQERQGGKQGRPKLQTPRDFASVLDGQVGAGSQEDAESGPHLPRHNQGSTDRSRAVFGGEDGDGGALATHADTKEQPRDEELFPGYERLGRDSQDA